MLLSSLKVADFAEFIIVIEILAGKMRDVFLRLSKMLGVSNYLETNQKLLLFFPFLVGK